MAETTVESIFGVKAGVVWRALNQNGPSNISDLVKSTSMSREEIYGALGWLGRENKIVLEQEGRAMVFSLRYEEACLPVAEDATAEPDQRRSLVRKSSQKRPRKLAQ
jgi:hypothetical protein